MTNRDTQEKAGTMEKQGKADRFFSAPEKQKRGCSTCGRVTWHPGKRH